MKKNLNNVIPHIPTKLALSNEEVDHFETAFKKLARNQNLTPVQKKNEIPQNRRKREKNISASFDSKWCQI